MATSLERRELDANLILGSTCLSFHIGFEGCRDGS